MFDSSRQCKQLQLEKPSSIKFDEPIPKRLPTILLLRVGQKGPPGSDRVKLEECEVPHWKLLIFFYNMTSNQEHDSTLQV